MATVPELTIMLHITALNLINTTDELSELTEKLELESGPILPLLIAVASLILTCILTTEREHPEERGEAKSSARVRSALKHLVRLAVERKDTAAMIVNGPRTRKNATAFGARYKLFKEARRVVKVIGLDNDGKMRLKPDFRRPVRDSKGRVHSYRAKDFWYDLEQQYIAIKTD